MNRIPRVLHLRTVTGQGGGPEKTLLNSPAFLRDRYDMRLAYIRPESDDDYCMPDRARRRGAHLIDIPERGAIDLRTLRRLGAEIRQYEPDLLHAHDYKTNVLGILLKKWFRIPCVTTMHGYVSRSARLNTYYHLDRWAINRMDYVVAVSSDLFEFLNSLRIPPTRYSLIHNGIDTEQVRRALVPSEARKQLGIPSGPVTIGAVGRLAAEKGFDLLISAIGELRRQGNDVQLVIVGDGEQRRGLEQQARQHGCEDIVHLVGHQADVIPFYEAFDIFALSSLREGLPNVVLEAMAMEVPVISTRVGGLVQLIDDQQTGILVDASDVAALTEGVGRLVNDAQLRKSLATSARQDVATRFSFSHRMQKIAGIYDGLLGIAPELPALSETV